jgi:hypothetical protein
MESVEALCQRAVLSVWKAFESKKHPLELIVARHLVRDIEQHLRGAQVSEPR